MRKSTSLVATALLVSIAGYFAAMQSAHADDGESQIDSKFRAKIVKEKAKAAVRNAQQSKTGQNGDADCGSQNIGNVNTGGRVGAAPREVFVFAPNAINVVSGRGCN